MFAYIPIYFINDIRLFLLFLQLGKLNIGLPHVAFSVVYLIYLIENFAS